jgi:DNA-binding transcriptional ArsR family regulator
MARNAKSGSSRAAEYVKVYRFMTEGMGLAGTALLVYARVFGFCKDTGGSFWESRRGTAEFLGMSERQVNRDFRRLEDDGLIRCVGEWRLPNGRITKRYEVADEPVRKALRIVARRHDPSLFDP